MLAFGGPVDVTREDLESVLREQFGHERFRPGQVRIIVDLLRGRDVLAVLPTGAGKSLVFQLPSILLPGLTVVVSPLLALMADQIESLDELGLRAAVMNSSRTASEIEADVAAIEAGEVKLLYVTPERLADPTFLVWLRAQSVSLFAVDEAHCISEWGHSFRPSYLDLGAAKATLGTPTTLALTATATPWVQRDIVDRLDLQSPDVVVRGLDRPNLFLDVQRVESEHDERHLLERLLHPGPSDDQAPVAAFQGSGIIYTATTRLAREAAGWLTDWGIAADYYHGQRTKRDRERVQSGFMAGAIRVIAATNAFGLGIDKPDIRFVIHLDVPPSLESYYQEAGRAGRDGAPARCTLIYRPGDLGQAAFLGASGRIKEDDIARLRIGLIQTGGSTRNQLQATTGLSQTDLARGLSLLAEQGMITERRGRIRLAVADFDPSTISLEREERRRAYEESRLTMMRGYAETRECRRRYLLNYFGEEPDDLTCGFCDNDRMTTADEPIAVTNEMSDGHQPFTLNDRLLHATLGLGTVQRIEDHTITVLFENEGYKTLDLATIQENGLVKRKT